MRTLCRVSFLGAWIVTVPFAFGQKAAAPAASAPVDQLIPWLLQKDGQLREVPFAEVIADTTGRKVIPVDPKSQTDQRVIKEISRVLDESR